MTGRDAVINICKRYGITPIFATIPTVPTINNEQKNAWIRNSGYRYIDFAKAVGADASGNWYSGMIESDNIHPSEKGAKALYSDKYAVEVAADVGASALVRGIRGDEDRAYEEDMAKFNREHGFETVFIEPSAFSKISSTLAREQISKGDYSSVPACCVSLITSKEFENLK